MHHAKKRLLVVFSLLAFMMNVVLPFYAISYSSAAFGKPNIEKDSLAALLGDKILICTSAGYKWVSAAEFFADSSGESLEDSDEESHNSFECPLCHLAKDDTNVVAPKLVVKSLATLPAYSFTSQWLQADYQHNKTYIFLSGGFTRAPPQALA